MSLLSTREPWWPFLQTFELKYVTQSGYKKGICIAKTLKFLTEQRWISFIFLFVFSVAVCITEGLEFVWEHAGYGWLSLAVSPRLGAPVFSLTSSTVCSSLGGGHMWLHVSLLQEHAAAGGSRPALLSAVEARTDCSVKRVGDSAFPQMFINLLLLHCSWESTWSTGRQRASHWAQ